VSLLEIHDLAKRFGGLEAVGGLSFTLAEGEVLGLIGPNGAGKTTVFNLISGYYSPDAGDIRFRGRSIVGLKPHVICLMGMTRTFQIVRPFPQLSVLDNVKVGALARHRHVGEALERARAVLQNVGLMPKAHVPAGSLTLAERKRLELARAMATEPTLLLLDEVMAGLNPTETGHFIELVARVNQNGISVLLIEHVMKAVMALSQRVVVLNYGEKIAEGQPEAVVRDARVVEAYLGEEYLRAQG
jgi:branched-chain amino acid transport system ATP-binding protein